MSTELLLIVIGTLTTLVSIYLMAHSKQQRIAARVEANKERIREFQELLAKAKTESTEALNEYNKKHAKYDADFRKRDS